VGVAGSRARARAAVERACALSDAVVATGGGTLLDPENRRRLTAGGLIICLTAPPEVILERVGDPASRPLLAGANGDRIERVRALLAQRAPVYALASHAVDTAGLSVDEVVERVQALVTGR
jgi:shikimate kinase